MFRAAPAKKVQLFITQPFIAPPGSSTQANDEPDFYWTTVELSGIKLIDNDGNYTDQICPDSNSINCITDNVGSFIFMYVTIVWHRTKNILYLALFENNLQSHSSRRFLLKLFFLASYRFVL